MMLGVMEGKMVMMMNDTDEDEDDDYATHATDDDGDVGCQGREQLKREL